jgi:hypothetical protein
MKKSVPLGLITTNKSERQAYEILKITHHIWMAYSISVIFTETKYKTLTIYLTI